MYLRRGMMLRGGAAAVTLGSLILGSNLHRAECAQQIPAPQGLAAKHPPTVLTVGESPEITLEYFCLRGLGELPRLILETTGTPYTSVFHYSGTPSYKPYAPFGQLPILRDGSLMISESGAIARHLARRCMVDGSTLEEKAKVDMYAELANDLKGKKAAIHDLENHDDAKKLRQFLEVAETACPDPASGRWFVSESLTLADIALFQQLHFFEEVQPGVLAGSGYSKLSSFVRRFAAIPNVRAYLDSPRRVPLTRNEVGDKPRAAGTTGYTFVKPLRVATYSTPWSGA